MKVLYSATILLFVCVVGCKNDKQSSGGIVTLDVEAAINNQCQFSLCDIAEDIELIALDSPNTKSLVGDIITLAESKSGFYIYDDMEAPVKFFDKTGKFDSTRGRVGNGPGEYNALFNMAVDYQTDNVYMNVHATLPNIFLYDPNNQMVVNASSTHNISTRLSYFENSLIVLHDPYVEQDTDGKVLFLDIFSSDLKREGSIRLPHKATNDFFLRGQQILSNNGQELLVKEELSDTLFHYRKGTLVPVYILDMGKYFFSHKMWDMSMEDQWEKYYMVSQLYDSSRYMIVSVDNGFFGERSTLIFDKRNPYDGFTAIGVDGKPGLFIDGIKFTPRYIRDNRLVGYMQALDIVDNIDNITDPDLKALATTLKEDSNPVIVVATLKK